MASDGQSGGIEYSLAWSYDSDSPELLRGAEVGELETRLALQPGEDIHMIMRISNQEMLRRIAGAHGRAYQTEIIDDTFMEVLVFASPVHQLLEKPPEAENT